MNIKDVVARRRQNLRLLIKERFNGVDRQFALHCGMSPSYVTRLFATPSEPKSRNLYDDKAAEIERLCGLREGWLDEAHTPGSVRSESKVRRLVVLLPDDVRQFFKRDVVPSQAAWMAAPSEIGPRGFAMVVRGKQMVRPTVSDSEPSFVPGSLVVVDPDVGPNDGSYVVVHAGKRGSALLRRYAIHDDGRRFIETLDVHGERMEMNSSTQVFGVVTQLVVSLTEHGTLAPP